MKYCVDYNTTKNQDYSNVDEIIFPYAANKTLLDLLLEEKFENKRKIIHINELDESSVKYMIAIKKEFPNLDFTINFQSYKDSNLLVMLKENNIQYFSTVYINNWDLYYEQLDLGVSDVYIVESLGFELDNVRNIANKYNVNIRTFPNVAQSEYKKLDGIYKFFIRPEDVNFYSQYIDVFEFYGDRNSQLHLVDIYKKEKWLGKLNEIIIDLNSDLDSRFLLPEFAAYRATCGKKCLKNKTCNICKRTEQLAKTLEKENIMIIKEK